MAQAHPLETAAGIRRFDLYRFHTANEGSVETVILMMVDATERERRQQRLTVLNRVLRHDLRNDAHVISARAGAVAEGRQPAGEAAASIRETVDDLVATGKKYREVEQMLQYDYDDPDPVDVVPVVERAVADCPDERLRVRVDAPERAAARADRRLATVLGELLENAAEHAAGDDPAGVTVTVREGPETVTISVADDGPGIPAIEREALADGETSLQHSLGIGLWTVKWVVEDLGGTVAFGSEDGAVVEITLLAP